MKKWTITWRFFRSQFYVRFVLCCVISYLIFYYARRNDRPQHRMWSNKLLFIDSNNTIKHLANAHSFTRNEFLNSSSQILKCFPIANVCVCVLLFVYCVLNFISSRCYGTKKHTLHCTERKWTSSVWSKAWIWIDIVIADRCGKLRPCKNEDEKWEIEAIFVASSWDNDVANGLDTFDCIFHALQMTWNSACVYDTNL